MTKEATKAFAALTMFVMFTLGTGTAMVLYLYQTFVAQVAIGSPQVLSGF